MTNHDETAAARTTPPAETTRSDGGPDHPRGESPWAFPLRIRTRRTLLRRHDLGDAADLLRFHSDPEVTRYLPWPVRDLQAVQETLATKVDQTALDRDGAWLSLAVEELDSGRVIGEVLLCRSDSAHGVAEVGYAFARDRHRRGYGTEAVAALLDVAWAQLPLQSVVAHIDVDNAASRHMVTKLGFREAGHKDGSDVLLRYVQDRPGPSRTTELG
ncbi:GNAT family N-acetyltransferase [Nocardioides sp. SYSU D00065]|uniref:GNAT family N-acetyltransferase n=1 Tax=Nocardioides sp. SYSU D00065 TaxID=2817378 RepID=UPI001B328BAD|nr:GNAT family N-acetyltransferase [Nocardioides sp. SYSU D00065]